LLLEECHLCTFLKVRILDVNHGQLQWFRVPPSLEVFFNMRGGIGTNFHIFLNALKA
jgi:hypothetical protein